VNIWLSVSLFILSAAGSLFFSVNVYALQFFYSGKLPEANGHKNKEGLISRLTAERENLLFVCSFCRLLCNMLTILFMLIGFESLKNLSLNIIDYCLVLATGFLIFMLFGYAVPYSWAKYAGGKVLSSTCCILLALLFIFKPFISVYKFTDILIRRLCGIVEITDEQRQEQFLGGVEQHKIEGIVDEEEQEMIENVLEMSEKTAQEIMTPRTDIVAIEANSDRQNVFGTVTAAGHSRFPVYEGNMDNIIGLLYAKDLLKDSDKCNEPFELRSKLRNAYFVPETKPIRELLREFQQQKLHIAVVLDEYGGTAGLISLEDILEVIVGEISDEYDIKPPEPVKRIDRYTVEADARTYVDDINDRFGLNLPDSEDYDTIGGFILSHLGSIPQAGTEFEYGDLKFKITAAEARRIKQVRITEAVKERNAE
jgi:putative hemolysin